MLASLFIFNANLQTRYIMMVNHVPTRVSLSQRGVQVGDVSCPLCDRFEEDHNHLFTLCSFAREVWSHVGIWLKLPIIPSSSLDALLDTSGYDWRNGSRQQIKGYRSYF